MPLSAAGLYTLKVLCSVRMLRKGFGRLPWLLPSRHTLRVIKFMCHYGGRQGATHHIFIMRRSKVGRVVLAHHVGLDGITHMCITSHRIGPPSPATGHIRVIASVHHHFAHISVSPNHITHLMCARVAGGTSPAWFQCPSKIAHPLHGICVVTPTQSGAPLSRSCPCMCSWCASCSRAWISV